MPVVTLPDGSQRTFDAPGIGFSMSLPILARVSPKLRSPA